MKLRSLIALLVVVFITSCGSEEKKKTTTKSPVKKAAVKKTPTKKVATKKVTSDEIIDLESKGIGPIKSVNLGATIDQSMADNGKKIFKNKCSSCHKTTKKFIGPNPTGILKRRSPEWIMNMIMNPAEMVKKDPVAKQLLIKFNGSPMANQNLTEEDTRAVLEYFRTLK